MKYKLVCVDMDGTLLNSRRFVSDATKNAIKRASDLGVDVTVTTGRIYANANYYSRLIGVKSPVIASNGAIIRGKGNEVIYENVINIDIIKSILILCKKFNMGINFHTCDSILCAGKAMYIMMLGFFFKFTLKSKPEKIKVRYIGNYNKFMEKLKNNNKIIKCEVIDLNSGKIAELRRKIEKIDGIEIASSSKNNIEITSKSVSKGNAIKVLANYYNIKREEIIAVGDSENDLSMIEYAGLGVAMGNGTEKAKKAADYITETNDNDGVAKAIEKFIL